MSEGTRTPDRRDHKTTAWHKRAVRATRRAGQETWYGKWWVGSSQIKRRIGPKRLPSTREGLTRTQAEAELRKPIDSVTVAQARRERMTIAEAGELLVASAIAGGHKRSTVMSYESVIRIHLAPFFSSRPLDRIGRREVQALAGQMTRRGSSPKSIRNVLGVLHRVFEYARREEWIEAPMRSLQEMMGHRDFKTTLIYADYAPNAHEAEWVEAAFAAPTVTSTAEQIVRAPPRHLSA